MNSLNATYLNFMRSCKKSKRYNMSFNFPDSPSIQLPLVNQAEQYNQAEQDDRKIQSLPEELILCIFNQLRNNSCSLDITTLGSLKLVCRSFNRIANAVIVSDANKNVPLIELGSQNKESAIEFAISHSLRTVNLIGFKDITDEDVKKLIENCPDLERLFIKDCKISDKSITALAQSKLRLTNLNLAECNKITDASITALAESKLPLTNLNLNSCNEITNASISALAESKLPLINLNLAWCYKITDASISALAKSKANCKILL